MKKNHSPGGARVFVRILGYSLIFVAVIGARETLTVGNGTVTNTLGRAFNRTLMASSKLGLGFADMTKDKPGQRTWLGKHSRNLGIASQKGFIAAAKVDIYAYASR